MPSSMDSPHGVPAASTGYETRDANVRGVFYFLVILCVVLILSALLCWGLFKYFSASRGRPAQASPFAGTRQLPSGPQLQVNPRQDYLRFRAEQEQSLKSYAWEDRSAGKVRVPIERAMELLLQRGLPVATETSSGETQNPALEGSAKR